MYTTVEIGLAHQQPANDPPPPSGSSNPYFSYIVSGNLVPLNVSVMADGFLHYSVPSESDVLVTPFYYYPAISFASRAKFCCLI